MVSSTQIPDCWQYPGGSELPEPLIIDKEGVLKGNREMIGFSRNQYRDFMLLITYKGLY